MPKGLTMKLPKLPKNIHSINNDQPHESWGGWKNFLKSCEVRDKYRGVTFFGKTNCNYIVFSDGLLVPNFGFHGKALMNWIREKGVAKVKKKLIEDNEKIQNLIKELKK